MRKALHIIKNIFVWALAVLAVFMMIFTIISVTTFDQADRSLFGFKAFIVRSDSMSATDFKAGDLILVKEIDPETLQDGDIITFMSPDPENYGEIISHKIREHSTDSEGNKGFVTYGTTTGKDDSAVVPYSFVIGKYQLNIPNVGTFFAFLKTPPGYIICIFVPFLLLIMIQGFNSIRLFRRYKKEQMEELNAEREKIENERAESQKMMAELLKLKSQLEENSQNKENPQAKEISQPNDNSGHENGSLTGEKQNDDNP